MGPRGWGMGLAALVLGLDQLLKQIALQSLEPGAPISIAPVFSLTLGFNEGVSFGMFSDWFGGRPLALAGLTMVIAALVALWLWRAGGRSQALALGAILGGALGNILDRVRLGAVVDFLDFHVGGYHWPAFNLADASIMLGLAAMILGDLIPARRREG